MAIRDLAIIHNVDPQVLLKLFNPATDVHAWDWLHNPKTMGEWNSFVAFSVVYLTFIDLLLGAYAFFGPGSFVDEIYAEICKPAAGMKLYIAGEATSSCHAYVSAPFKT